MNIKTFAELWRNEKSDKKASVAFWDHQAAEFNSLKNKADHQERFRILTDFFQAKQMLKSNTTVLDIGCGPGYASMAIAPKVKQVTGFDISPKMLEFAQENIRENNFTNINLSLLDWDTADLKKMGWEKKFDLVFAARCPGINSKETLEKMIQASREFCFLSTFANMESSFRRSLNKIIWGREQSITPGQTAYYSFNLLWLMGFYPEITYYDTGWESVYTLDEAISTFTKYYEMRQILNAAQKNDLYAYIKKTAVNNLIQEQVKVKVAWLLWKV